MAAFRFMNANDVFGSERESKEAAAILDYEWTEEAKKDPESLAGQLSRMVTKELFQIHEISAKTAFLLQNPARNIVFREGSCRVNNVALLSARACLFVERDASEAETGNDGKAPNPRYEAIDYEPEDEDSRLKTAVAAQLEVLYDVTQEFTIEKSQESSQESPASSDQNEKIEGANDSATDASSGETESTETTIVSVATFEGWLQGGPDNELRWKLTLHRPAFEFPGIEQAY
jgi:hypothetical protein